MNDVEDEMIIREQLTGVVEEYIREAFEARSNLLEERRRAHDLQARKFKDEIDQLELKKIRISSNLKRASVADLQVYHYLFMGREMP